MPVLYQVVLATKHLTRQAGGHKKVLLFRSAAFDVMSHESLMVRINIFIIVMITLSGCASKGFRSYSCMQFEEEPQWHQVALDQEYEEHLRKLVEIHYSEAPKGTFLMNKGKKRKYFWYKAESGQVLACIVDRKMWQQYHEGCFADRIIITTNNGTTTLKETDSVVCT